MRDNILSSKIMRCLRDAMRKKIAEKEKTLVYTGERGVKKFPYFSSTKVGHILMKRGVKGQNLHFCVPVSAQFVAVFETLHYENFSIS